MKYLLPLILILSLPSVALAAGGHEFDWCEKVEQCVGPPPECWPHPWVFYACRPGSTRPAPTDATRVHICTEDTETGERWSYRRTKDLRKQADFDVWRLQGLVCPR